MTGFTLEDSDGAKWEYQIPEYLRWPVYNYPLDQRGLAATLIAIRKLQSVPQGAIVQPVHLDTPGEETDRVSLLVGAFSLGVLSPVTAGQLLPYLTNITEALLPCSETPSSDKHPTDTTERIDLTVEDLERIEFRGEDTDEALTLNPGARYKEDLGFAIRHNPLKLDVYEPRNAEARESIQGTAYEDRVYAMSALVATIAEEKSIAGAVEIGKYPLDSVAFGVINRTRRLINGKTPQQILEQLSEFLYKK